MNDPAVDSNIEHNCQQTEIVFSQKTSSNMGASLILQQQQNAALQGPATQQTNMFAFTKKYSLL